MKQKKSILFSRLGYKQLTAKAYVVLLSLFITVVVTGCKKQVAEPHQPISTNTATTNSQLDLVSTPFGKIPASKVHLVEPGTEITEVDGRLKQINSITGSIIQDFGPAAITNSNENTSGKTIQSIHQKPLSGVGNGYYVYGDLPSGKNIQSFSTSWVVPGAPSRDSTLFLWNGADNSSDGGAFMQPVLGWNNGQGRVWFIQNWGFANGQYFHSNAMTVTSGTTVTGVITQVSATHGKYKYTIAFSGYPSITYTQSYSEPANEVIEDWEAYTNTYLAFPPNQYVAMKSMVLNYVGSGSTNQPISWVQTNDGAIYTPSGKNTVILNNGTANSEVDFYFQ